MINYLATLDKKHSVRKLTDHVYWYKHYDDKKRISRSYQWEIQILEAVRGDVIPFLQAVIDIGAE